MRSAVKAKNGESLILIIICCSWLFLPKINLIELGGYEQGIRAQDFIFLIGIFLIIGNIFKGNKVELLFGGGAAFNLITYMLLTSALSIIFLESQSSNLIFSFRWLQYFIFGGMVVRLAKISFNSVIKIAKCFVYFNFIHAIFSLAVNGLGERFEGFTSGPWEIASMLIFLFIGIHPYITKKEKIILFGMSIIIVLAAKARMQMVAIFLIFLVDTGLRKYILNKYAIILIPLLLAYNIDEILIYFRFENLGYTNLLELIEIAKTIDADFDYYGITSVNDNIDASLLGRFVIWMGFINKWLQAKMYGVFFGIGPGTGGVNVDGFYIRLITEFGLIGTLFFYKLLKKIYRKILDPEKKWIAISVIIICITLDPFTSQKIFSALSIAAALLIAKRKNMAQIEEREEYAR